MLLDDLREKKVGKVVLDYTEEGHPLYQSLGFEELGHQMKLSL